MNTIRHLVWFDFLALRIPLLVWGALLLVEAALFYAGPPAVEARQMMSGATSLVAIIIRFAATVVVTSLLVHADPLVGTTAFWRTRPVSRVTLLCGKLLSAVLWLVLLPGVVCTAVLLLLGLDPASAARGGALVGAEQAAIVLGGLMAASVTKNLLHFAVAGLAGLAIVMAVNSALLPVLVRTWPAIESMLAWWPRDEAMAAALVVAAGAVVFQFLTLRTGAAMVMLACGTILLSVAPFTGGLAARRAGSGDGRVAASVMNLSNLVVSVVPGSQRVQQTTQLIDGTPRLSKSVSFEIGTSGQPAEVTFQLDSVKAVVELQDQAVFKWAASQIGSLTGQPSRPATRDDQPYRGLRAALGDIELLRPSSGTSAWVNRGTLVDVPDDQARRLGGLPARLRVDLTLRVRRFTASRAIPLVRGSTLRNGPGVDTLESVTLTPAGMMVEVRNTSVGDGGLFGGRSFPMFFVARNMARRQAVTFRMAGARFSTYSSLLRSTPVRTEVYQFQAKEFDGDRIPAAADEAWWAGAEFLIVRWENLGTITRPLVVDPFVIEPAEPPTPNKQGESGK